MDGMLLWYDIDPDYAALYGGTVWNPGRWYKDCDDGSGIPDLSDPATVGCLVALVREVLSDPHLSTRSCTTVIDGVWSDGPWAVVTYSCHVSIEIATGETEAEALVVALEAAP